MQIIIAAVACFGIWSMASLFEANGLNITVPWSAQLLYVLAGAVMFWMTTVILRRFQIRH